MQTLSHTTKKRGGRRASKGRWWGRRLPARLGGTFTRMVQGRPHRDQLPGVPYPTLKKLFPSLFASMNGFNFQSRNLFFDSVPAITY